MKKILLDENLPQPLRHHLHGHDVVTIGYLGWSGIQNGELIGLIDGKFDILITSDQNLRYQQNLRGRKISIIELPHTRLEPILEILPGIHEAIQAASEGSYARIGLE